MEWLKYNKKQRKRESTQEGFSSVWIQAGLLVRGEHDLIQQREPQGVSYRACSLAVSVLNGRMSRVAGGKSGN